jgi:AcrR family transcriptional regulator
MKTYQTIKTKKGQATAKSITEAAMKLFKTKGYENTTVVDICHAANVGYGTLYHYFKTKQDIMIHLSRKKVMIFYIITTILKKKPTPMYSIISANTSSAII